MALAEIISGHYAESTSVVVHVRNGSAAGVATGTNVKLWRGTTQLGSANTDSTGAVNITVPPLAEGDILVASVDVRGNLAGVPVMVLPDDDQPTGWRLPTTLEIVNEAGQTETLTAQQYLTRFGVSAPASYDPSLLVPRVSPDTPDPVTLDNICFDAEITMQPELTTLTLADWMGIQGSVLIKWGNESWGNDTQRSFTTNAQIVTVSVKGSLDADSRAATRQFVLTVLGPVVANQPPFQLAYRFMGYSNTPGATGWYFRLFINDTQPCEAKIDGFAAGAWRSGTVYTEQGRADYREIDFHPVPAGQRTITARRTGETNPQLYQTLTLQF